MDKHNLRLYIFTFKFNIIQNIRYLQKHIISYNYDINNYS